MRALKNAVLKRLESQKTAAWCAPLRMARNLVGWKRAKPALQDCRRILVIRPDEIGDVVLTSPFLRNLRSSAPHARITAVTNETCRPLLENCPYVDDLYSLPFSPNLEPAHRARVVVAAIKLKWSRLWKGFDLVLLPRLDADWHNAELAAHLVAGQGTVVVNSATFVKWTTKMPESSALADSRYAVRVPQSDVLSNLEFLQACGATVGSEMLEFWHSERDALAAETWLSAQHLEGRVVVFHPPGGRSVLRRWPVGRSRELVEKLLSTGFSVVVVGGPEDVWVKSEFDSLHHPRFRMAVGLLRLGELGALIRSCAYFVGGDSGPMHVAASVGAKTVGIFGPGSQIRFMPWSEKSNVSSLRLKCAPDQVGSYEAYCLGCIHAENRCMTELRADDVLMEVKASFGASSRGTGDTGDFKD